MSRDVEARRVEAEFADCGRAAVCATVACGADAG